ncbi:hypothetical protein EV385_2462 [Krasilnikovia cinnamomea]|uniref:Uncharacterized protein n=1 Tax=Krasilnikovia cinnamomea TaxID=349313 RepID=A0A4Q7ZJK4_9ACTN|nr:hypothetical protein [Krasilnikovia cinnamomea]RZU50684.1 hypothetical protein EV385_2462 [Krasilnikovia cinnamomea]
MSGRSLFARQPIGAVAIVETPVSQWYARKARITVAVVGLAVDALVTAVLSVFCPLLLAIVLGAVAGLVCGVVAGVLVRVWPVLRVLWWWSFELIAALLVVGGPVTIAHLAGRGVALAVVLLVPVLCLAVWPVRRFVAAWSWVPVVRHRLRLCFAGIVRGTGGVRPGSLPLVLWARPTPAGERVWLWLRPGLELADLDGKAGRIAVACWAKQVRVLAASDRYAALLRIDVARRDPLTGRVESPLALLVPGLREKYLAEVPVSPGLPPVGLELADIDEPPAPEPRGGRR